MRVRGDALGLLESTSIAAGVRAADELMKTAPVHLIEACPISPGKFLVIFCGGVGEVEAAMLAGRAVCRETLRDELLLAQVHPEVPPAVARREPGPESVTGPAVGIVETETVASAIVAADAAAKSAEVRILEIATGRGIGGKGFFTLTGEVGAVQAGAEAAALLLEPRGTLIRTELLTGPHEQVALHLARTLMREPRGLSEGD